MARCACGVRGRHRASSRPSSSTPPAASQATIDVNPDVAAGGSLAWLPQETILFDRARLKRAIDVDLAEDARLILAEAIVFGRSGMGEAVHDSFLFDRW